MICGFDSCEKKAHAKGLCTSHYRQQWEGQTLRPLRSRRQVSESKRTHRDVYLWSHYKLTLDEYDALAANGCVLCGVTQDLVVDHDHTCCPGRESCGKCVRGVLCRTHNVWLGMVRDDIAFVERAVEYLIFGRNLHG